MERGHRFCAAAADFARALLLWCSVGLWSVCVAQDSVDQAIVVQDGAVQDVAAQDAAVQDAAQPELQTPSQPASGTIEAATSPAQELADAGNAAWLVGARERASEAWRAALEANPKPALRPALYYNLGNVAWHAQRPLEAVAWYTAALPLAPREPDLLDNLDFARREAGLPPRDRGDLLSALERYLSAWTEGEARWLALLGLIPLAVALCGEALRGGAAWRLLALGALLLALAAAAPYAQHQRRLSEDAGLVVAPTGARLLCEPALTKGAVAPTGRPLAEAGSRVRRIDAVEAWVRVVDPSGERGWIPRDAFFELTR